MNWKKHIKERKVVSIKEANGYTCHDCGKYFSKRQYLNRHILSHSKIKCDYCTSMFSRKDALQIHIRKFHADNLLEKQNFDCIHCDCIFTDYTKLIEYISLQHPLPRNQIGGQQTSPLLSETLKKNRSVTSRQRDTISVKFK